MIFKNPEPKNLEEWVEMATKGIAAAGRERITREIEVHFAEAVEAHAGKGESEQVAQTKALTELGDAKNARIRFRKQHLTKLEEWRVVRLPRWPSKGRTLITVLMGFWLMFMVHICEPIHFRLYLVPICVGWIVTPVVLFRKVNRPGTRSMLSFILSIQSLQFAIVLFLWALNGFTDFEPVFGSIAVLCLIAFSVQSFGTWKKIRRIEDPAIST